MENLSASGPKMDIPGSLPIEIFHEILKYLSFRDLHNVRDCCEKWRNHMDFFWKIKCKIDCYLETEDDLNSQFYRKFMKRYSRWEGIYMYNSKLEDNWVNQNFKEVVNNVDSFKGILLHYFCGDLIIASSAVRKEIWLVNATTAVVEKRFDLIFPKGTVIICIHAVRKIENKLIVVVGTATLDEDGYFTSSEIMNIKVWNIETEKLLLSLKMKNMDGRVKEVLICKNVITFLTHSHRGYIYNIKNNVDYNRSCVTNVCHDNDKIAMLHQTGTLAIIDMDYTELGTFNCCDSERTIIKIQMNGNYLITISKSSKEPGLRACIWNINAKTKLYQIEKVLLKELAMYLHENRLCYVYEDFQPRKFSFMLCRLDTGDCILKLAYGCVRSHNFFVIKRDNTDGRLLKVWSIKTGKLIGDLQLPQPLPFQFLENDCSKEKSKSKFAYLDYNRTHRILRIMDFEANIEG